MLQQLTARGPADAWQAYATNALEGASELAMEAWQSGQCASLQCP